MAASVYSYEQLRAAFEKGQFEPLYLFHGEERLLKVELQDVLVQNALALHEQDFNLDVIYGHESDAAQVLARCAGYPMMAERRVVLVREFDKLPENRSFAGYAEAPNPHAVVVLVVGGKANFSTHPYRALKAHAALCEFKKLDGRALPRWTAERARDAGCELDPDAAQMLIDLVGGELSDLASEVDKLVTFVADRKRITPEDVLVASGQTREHNIFELQRAVAEGRYEDSLRITDRLLQRSPNPKGEALRILGVLGLFFLKLWRVAGARAQGASNQEMAKLANVPAYYLKEYTRALRRFGHRQFESAFSALLSADYELKGGSARDERLILYLMLERILQPVRAARAA